MRELLDWLPPMTTRRGGLQFRRPDTVDLFKPYPRGVSSEDLDALIEYHEQKIQDAERDVANRRGELEELHAERRRRTTRWLAGYTQQRYNNPRPGDHGYLTDPLGRVDPPEQDPNP